MKLSNIANIQLQIMINNNLFQKNIIDEVTHSIVNDKLLKMTNKQSK